MISVGTETYTVLGLIPARGGSKSIPCKNLAVLGGRSLLELTIACARRSRVLDRLVVSTDDPEIAAAARDLGADVPFMRPAELATDDTPDAPVFVHALNWLSYNEGDEPDIVVHLRPTAPFRLPTDIDGAVRVLVESGADCVRSVTEARHHPYWMKSVVDGILRPFVEGADEAAFPRRQTLPPAFWTDDRADGTWRKRALETGQLYSGRMAAFVSDDGRSLDINTEADLRLAEAMINMGLIAEE